MKSTTKNQSEESQYCSQSSHAILQSHLEKIFYDHHFDHRDCDHLIKKGELWMISFVALYHFVYKSMNDIYTKNEIHHDSKKFSYFDINTDCIDIYYFNNEWNNFVDCCSVDNLERQKICDSLRNCHLLMRKIVNPNVTDPKIIKPLWSIINQHTDDYYSSISNLSGINYGIFQRLFGAGVVVESTDKFEQYIISVNEQTGNYREIMKKKAEFYHEFGYELMIPDETEKTQQFIFKHLKSLNMKFESCGEFNPQTLDVSTIQQTIHIYENNNIEPFIFHDGNSSIVAFIEINNLWYVMTSSNDLFSKNEVNRKEYAEMRSVASVESLHNYEATPLKTKVKKIKQNTLKRSLSDSKEILKLNSSSKNLRDPNVRDSIYQKQDLEFKQLKESRSSSQPDISNDDFFTVMEVAVTESNRYWGNKRSLSYSSVENKSSDDSSSSSLTTTPLVTPPVMNETNEIQLSIDPTPSTLGTSDDSDRHQNTSFHDDPNRHQNTSFHDNAITSSGESSPKSDDQDTPTFVDDSEASSYSVNHPSKVPITDKKITPEPTPEPPKQYVSRLMSKGNKKIFNVSSTVTQPITSNITIGASAKPKSNVRPEHRAWQPQQIYGNDDLLNYVDNCGKSVAHDNSSQVSTLSKSNIGSVQKKKIIRL